MNRGLVYQPPQQLNHLSSSSFPFYPLKVYSLLLQTSRSLLNHTSFCNDYKHRYMHPDTL